MLKTVEELKDAIQAMGEDNRRFHIQFDYPNEDKAVMHVVTGGVSIMEINCWRWAETRNIRIAFAYGSNHDSRALDWTTVRRALLDNIEDQETYGMEKELTGRRVV